MLPGADILEVETADGVKLPIPLFHYSTPGPTCPLKQCTVQCQTPTNQRKTNKCKSSYQSNYSTIQPLYLPAHSNSAQCSVKHPQTKEKLTTASASQVTYHTFPPLHLLAHSNSAQCGVKHPQTKEKLTTASEGQVTCTCTCSPNQTNSVKHRQTKEKRTKTSQTVSASPTPVPSLTCPLRVQTVSNTHKPEIRGSQLLNKAWTWLKSKILVINLFLNYITIL